MEFLQLIQSNQKKHSHKRALMNSLFSDQLNIGKIDTISIPKI